MAGDTTQKPDPKAAPAAIETAADDLAEIDPAEFSDPEEFGIIRRFPPKPK